MQKANEQMRGALNESIHELFLSEDNLHSTEFLSILNDIRSDLNLVMIDSRYAEKHIWEKFRKTPSMLQTLMSTTATFLQGVDDLDDTIMMLVPRLVPFTNQSEIVDDETIGKAVDQSALADVLKKNYWLLFIIYAATNMRVVQEAAAEYIPRSSKAD